jgi:hypothetical protein
MPLRTAQQAIPDASNPYYCVTHATAAVLQTRSIPQALPENMNTALMPKHGLSKVCTLTVENLAYSTTPRCTRCWECGMQSECT